MDKNSFIKILNNLNSFQNQLILVREYCLDNNKTAEDTIIFMNYLDARILPILINNYIIPYYINKYEIIIIKHKNRTIMYDRN